MEAMPIIESIFRWIHVVAGVLWIGLLYFFNWVNGVFASTMDAETKKKVVPELLPRTLFWFRWGAAYTWVSGVLLLLLVFYHGGVLFEDQYAGWTTPVFVMIAVTFLGVFIYDLLMNKVKNEKVTTIVGFILICGVSCLMAYWAGFSYRGQVIHVGALFGTIMAFNVWFRIWPAQQKIVTAIKNGEKPDAVLVGLAGLRSKQNTYLSLPLIWIMLNQHTTWAASSQLYLFGAIVIGWFGVHHLYKLSKKVKGF